MAKRLGLFFLLVSCHTGTKINTNMGADALPQPYVEWDIHGEEIFSREKNVSIEWKSGGYQIDQFSVEVYLAEKNDCEKSVKRPSSITTNSVTFEELREGKYHLCLNASINDIVIQPKNNGATLIVDLTAPVFTSLSLIHGAADKAVSYDEVLLDKDLVSKVEGSGQSLVTYGIAAAEVDCSTLTPFENEKIPTAGLLASKDNGSYKVCARLSDKAGHKTYGVSEIFVLDTKAPATALTTFAAINTEATRLMLEWTAAKDAVTPTAKLKYSVYRSTNSDFDTIQRVEQGTLLHAGGALDLKSLQVENLAESSTYFFNIVVENERGFKSLYRKLEARTKARTGASFIQIGSGALNHRCAIADDRNAYCWGANEKGQLGHDSGGVSVDKTTLVSGGLAFQDIHSGAQSSCGLTVAGEMYCWGKRSTEATHGHSPEKVSTGRFTQLAMGIDHACAIESDGDLFCWGASALSTTTKFRTIKAAGARTCGIAEDSRAYCWVTSDHAPTAVSATDKFRDLAVGANVQCGINEAGKVFCWGSNSTGALGIGSTGVDAVAPTAIQSTETFRAIAAADESVCAITAAGATYCWGRNDKGQLGIGNTITPQTTPKLLNHGHNYVKIAAKAHSFCGITATGKTFCWGSDEHGQLGNGAESGDKSFPQAVDMSQVTGEARFTNMLAGGWSSCGLTSQGDVYCGGAYSDSILGYGGALTGPASRPVPVPTMQKFTALTNGYDHQCGLNAEGRAFCWGLNDLGQLGDASTSVKEVFPRAVSLQNGAAFIQIAAGNGSSCGLVGDGTVYCWGSDEFGQLGDGEPYENKNVPVAIASSHKFVSIAAGESHNCAITQNGAAYCWGRNDKKQLGDGTASMDDSALPKLVDGNHHFVSVTAGKNHTCGVTVRGTAYCWGSDNVGQSGNGDHVTGLKSTPHQLDSSEIFRSVLTGVSFTCGLTNAGKPFCWGSNGWGRLGIGVESEGAKTTPQPVASSETFVSISSGYAHACGLSQRNLAVCWGHDGFEQLSDGPGAKDVNAPGAFFSIE